MAVFLAVLVLFSAAPPPAAVDRALVRAAKWMAVFPADELRFDAAVGLAAVSRRFDHPALERALSRARRKADGDRDNPMRRIWDRSVSASRQAVQGWTPPGRGMKRANTNRPVVEALHCDRHPLREETLAYITGPMRDEGGYHTAHGLWALVLARDNLCLFPLSFEALAGPLRDDLRAAQPGRFEPEKTLDIDLYAERAVVLMLAGDEPDAGGWVATLLALQNPDGSWGIQAGGEPAYFRFHATLTASWALALWRSPTR